MDAVNRYLESGPKVGEVPLLLVVAFGLFLALGMIGLAQSQRVEDDAKRYLGYGVYGFMGTIGGMALMFTLVQNPFLVVPLTFLGALTVLACVVLGVIAVLMFLSR